MQAQMPSTWLLQKDVAAMRMWCFYLARHVTRSWSIRELHLPTEGVPPLGETPAASAASIEAARSCVFVATIRFSRLTDSTTFSPKCLP
mgnify:CR=1 FL=1